MQDRKVAAFARAASTIAWEGSLQTVLDHLAEVVLVASRATSCALTLVSRFGSSVELFGSAGYPEGSVERINEVLALRAPLLSLEAYRTRVEHMRDVKNLMASDPRFEPYADMADRAGWTTLVSIPLLVGEECVGALTALYSDHQEPDDPELAFLRAMADHGAIAISTARLLVAAKEKAAMEERNRMARDIHDAVSQSLFSIRLRTKALQIAAGRVEDPSGTVVPALVALELIVDRAVNDMRALVLQLRPTDLQGKDLAEAIERYAGAVCADEDVALDVQLAGEVPKLADDAEMEVYQVAREAIGNSVRHAGAAQLRVKLGPVWRRGAGYLFLDVADDGRGFDPEHRPAGHVGISGMRSRAADLGAELTIGSSPDGTTVRLEVPLTRTRRARRS